VRQTCYCNCSAAVQTYYFTQYRGTRLSAIRAPSTRRAHQAATPQRSETNSNGPARLPPQRSYSSPFPCCHAMLHLLPPASQPAERRSCVGRVSSTSRSQPCFHPLPQSPLYPTPPQSPNCPPFAPAASRAGTLTLRSPRDKAKGHKGNFCSSYSWERAGARESQLSVTVRARTPSLLCQKKERLPSLLRHALSAPPLPPLLHCLFSAPPSIKPRLNPHHQSTTHNRGSLGSKTTTGPQQRWLLPP
jgi:hypothetical protein